MFAILWAVPAILAAGASIGLVLEATTGGTGLRAAVRAIDAEPGRPGLRDPDLGARVAGHPPPAVVTVASGSRSGPRLLITATVLAALTLAALITGSGATGLVATLSLLLSGCILVRFGHGRQLRVDGSRLRLRRWRGHFDIPLEAVHGVGLVPSRAPGAMSDGRVRLSLWCDPAAVTGLPDALADAVAVGPQVAWLRLDPIDAVSTAQLLRLWQFFATRWTVGDEDGAVHPTPARDMAEQFGETGRLEFVGATGHYTVDGESVGHVVRRTPTRWQVWLRRISRNTEGLSHTFEVRDSRLRTRWVISKPNAAWKTAFYVTDRHGRRIGTLRATSVSSRNFDLCGVDNRVLATLRPGEPRSVVVDTHGAVVASWDTETGELVSNAPGSVRLMCLLSPIVARFVGKAPLPAPDNSTTMPLDIQVPPPHHG